MRSLRLLTAGMLAAFVCAPVLAQTSTTPATPATPPTAASPAASAARALARADQNFLKDAARAGHAEMEASKRALQKAQHAQVKSFAQRMVDDHGKAHQELAALAASKNVKLPDEPSIAQRTRIRWVDSADGASFDERYARSFGVKAHRDTVALFQKAASGAADADVRAFAQKTLPAVQQHLTQAEEMLRAVERDHQASARSATQQR